MMLRHPLLSADVYSEVVWKKLFHTIEVSKKRKNVFNCYLIWSEANVCYILYLGLVCQLSMSETLNREKMLETQDWPTSKETFSHLMCAHSDCIGSKVLSLLNKNKSHMLFSEIRCGWSSQAKALQDSIEHKVKIDCLPGNLNKSHCSNHYWDLWCTELCRYVC